MLFTKELIEEKVENNDYRYFVILNSGERLYVGDKIYRYKDYESEVKHVYEQSHGDGNELEIVLHFPLLGVYVMILGTYSSWDSNTYDSVQFVEPYEFKETRYRAIRG